MWKGNGWPVSKTKVDSRRMWQSINCMSQFYQFRGVCVCWGEGDEGLLRQTFQGRRAELGLERWRAKRGSPWKVGLPSCTRGGCLVGVRLCTGYGKQQALKEQE